MKNYNELLKELEIKPISYLKKGKSLIIKTKDKKYVLKEKINNPFIYQYLISRSFKCCPIILIENDNYELREYIENIDVPEEQKLEELMKTVALLHSKKTYDEKTNLAYNKEIYENLKNNIEYLKSYYEDIIALIDTKEFMSPSEYLFARNYTIIINSLAVVSEKLEKWYKKAENETSVRIVILHNNLSLDHLIYNDKKYLISWRKAKFGSHIFDLLAIFNKYGAKYDFQDKLKIYEEIYPLKNEELELLHIFMLMPPKIEFKSSEYDLCELLTQKLELLYEANKMILPNQFKDSKEDNQNKDKNHENTKFS